MKYRLSHFGKGFENCASSHGKSVLTVKILKFILFISLGFYAVFKNTALIHKWKTSSLIEERLRQVEYHPQVLGRLFSCATHSLDLRVELENALG